jgi:hypothetical protein
MRRVAALGAALVALFLATTACSKIPDAALCKSACVNLIDMMGKARNQQLATLPQEYRDKFDQKVADEGKSIVEGCVATCGKEGSIASAECLTQAKNLEDVAKCRSLFGGGGKQ